MSQRSAAAAETRRLGCFGRFGRLGRLGRLDRLDAAALVLIGVAAATLWLRLAPTTEGAGWIGWDAYPILLASHADGAGEAFDVATRRLAGEYFRGGFYRPVFMLSVSAEQSFLEASPTTSLAIQVTLFALCLAALWAWLRSVAPPATDAGRDVRAAGLVALPLVCLHPSVLEVVPYLPRRADLLSLLFVLLALRFDAVWTRRGTPSALALALACAVLAMASKETALVLPLLVVANRRLLSSESARGAWTWRRQVRPLAAYGVAVGLAALPRLLILGGAGGYVDAERAVPSPLRVVASTALRLVLPAGEIEDRPVAVVAVALLGLGCVGALVGAARGSERRSRSLRLPAVASVWFLASALLFAAAGRVSPWYLLFVVVGVAVGLGAVAVEVLRRPPRFGDACPGVRFLSAVAFVGGLALLLHLWWPTSLPGASTAEFREAGRTVERCLAETARRCDRAGGGGEAVAAPTCPSMVQTGHRTVATLRPRSLAAWAAWARPDCRLAVGARGGREQTTSAAGP